MDMSNITSYAFYSSSSTRKYAKMPALRALLLKNSLFHYAALRVLNVTKK